MYFIGTNYTATKTVCISATYFKQIYIYEYLFIIIIML